MHEPKVLLIEDHTGIAVQIRQYLINLSYGAEQIVLFQNPADTLKSENSDCTFIILPVCAPGESNEVVLQILQQHFLYQSIILVASREQEETALQIVALGAEDYIIREDMNEAVLQKTIRSAAARNTANYKKLFEESPAPMYMYDKKTFRFMAVNKACCRQYGYSKEEFLKMTAEQIRPEEEVPAFHRVTKITPNEYHDYGRWRHRKKNEEVFTANVYAHDTIFSGKEARLVTAVDISNTLLAESQLHDKNEEMNNILESITDGFFTLNRKGDFTYINKECERIFGIGRSEMIGKNIRDVYNKDEYAAFYTQYQEAENKRKNVRVENYINSIGKWLSATLYPNKNGMAVYLVDITERRLIREKLYNDGQQLRAIINNTPDIIWLLDNDGNITMRNEAFRGWMQQLIEEPETSRLPSSITTNWKDYFEMAGSGQAVTFTAMETKKNELFYREVSLYPVCNAGGNVVQISCFARDVTQQQLRVQKIQLQNEYLEKIAWMHSHEARGPVANILGLAGLFNMNDVDDPDNKMMMELIIESSYQLDKVIRRIVADIDHYQLNYGDDDE